MSRSIDYMHDDDPLDYDDSQDTYEDWYREHEGDRDGRLDR